jgi:ribosomal protein S18 acetylase RimI-like enzyme
MGRDGSRDVSDKVKSEVTTTVRAATEADRDAIWEIFREVIAAGETYPIDPDISRDDALAYWFQPGAHAYVAEQESVGDGVAVPGKPSASPTVMQDRRILGSYTVHSNQSGGGAHVANAAFIVAKHARGQGIGRSLGEHCFSEARRLGFRAMQFNFVISTNEGAVKLWQDLGMKIVGTLPGAFHHPKKGYVNVYVMYRSLLA